MKKLIILVVCVALCSCKDVPMLGSYVYYDKYSCLHTTNYCKRLQKSNYQLVRVETEKVRDIRKTCSECVNDYIYEILKEKIKKTDFIMELYNKLSNVYYDLPSEEEFLDKMDDEDYASEIYEILVGDSIKLDGIADGEEFLEKLGFYVDGY
jgi:hypothetical protein